jgi:CheY-like chemotaxis protein
VKPPLKRVLAVDDDPDILAVVALALRTLGGLDVITAASGAEALGLLGRETVDLVLLDVMMPGIDGLETLAAMQGNPALRHIPVVLMTARVKLYEQGAEQPAGVLAIIPKPFDPVTLPRRLQTLWEGHAK